MRILLLLLIAGALVLMPFLALKKPWAVRVWRQLKLLVVAYVIAVFAIAVYWLITRWDEFYG
jgi:hypothetical protein